MISLNSCLDFIVGVLDRLYAAFTVSNNEISVQNSEILRTSSERSPELFGDEYLKAQYLTYLTNARLKFLDLQNVNPNYRNSLEDIFCRLPHLNELSCFEINDEILKNLARFCPKLVEIRSTVSSVTNDGIKYLCRDENGKIPCSDLKTLSIWSDDDIDEGIKCLIKDLPRLEKINYVHLPRALHSLYNESLRNVEKIPDYNLIHLHFYYCNPDVIKACLTLCPRLKTVELHGIMDVEQLNVFNNTNLEEFTIRVSIKCRGININNFLTNNGNNLITLNVHRCLMSLDVLSASCPKLKNLDIDEITFIDDSYNSQAVLHSLIECSFVLTGDDNMSSRAMRLLLSSSPNIERLIIRGGRISSTVGNCISEYCKNNFLKHVIIYHYTKFEWKWLDDIRSNSSAFIECL